MLIEPEKKEELLKLVSDIETVLKKEPQGVANPYAMNKIKSLTLHITWTTSQGNIVEKASHIAHQAEILYSARKHQSWGGPDRIYQFILQDIMVLKSIIKY